MKNDMFTSGVTDDEIKCMISNVNKRRNKILARESGLTEDETNKSIISNINERRK